MTDDETPLPEDIEQLDDDASLEQMRRKRKMIGKN